MSKSIYDEALLKLREIAEKLTRKQWIELTNNIELIRSNLQQAQKQEKLLDLYRYLYKNTNDYDLVTSISYDAFSNWSSNNQPLVIPHRHFELVDEIHNKIDKIEERIKELENDNT